MVMSNTPTGIPKLKFREPKRNLSGKASLPINKEDQFTIRFARAYLTQFESLHHKTPKTSIACAREIPINGFGIADFVTVAWNANRLPTKSSIKYDSKSFIQSAKPTMRAFEMKLSNWRRAMMQASRYKTFANTSIIVLPAKKCKVPLQYLDTFKKVGIGLWGFSPDSNQIITHFTPKPTKPFDSKYLTCAIKLVAAASKTLPIF